MASPATSPPSPVAGSLSAFERGVITVGVMIATLMYVLDMTIANVAIPHMQSSLGATPDTVSWVLTSYIVSAAVAIALTDWLAGKIGRKPFYIGSVAAFTIASLLCAVATSLPEMVLFRILQGIAGAFLMPLAQAVMLDIYPPEKHAKAMTIFGIGVVTGPIMGPVIGGLLTDAANWRWVFLVNLPVGLLSLFLLRFLPRVPREKRRFDLVGFVLLAIALGSLQLLLDRGAHKDWFESWEIVIELGLAMGAFWMFCIHIVDVKDPIFDPRMFADRNFFAAFLITVATGLMMLAGVAITQPLLQSVLGYPVLESGLVTVPRGAGTLVAMIITGALGSRVDPRVLVAAGMVAMVIGVWLMTGFTLDMDEGPIIISGIFLGVGIGLVWIPTNLVAFATLAASYRTSAASMLTLGRSVGGSIGISVAVTLIARNMQVSHSDLASQVTPASMPAIDPAFLGAFGNAGASLLPMLDMEINRQAAMIAYIDIFWLMMIFSITTLPLLLLMRKSRAKAAPPVILE